MNHALNFVNESTVLGAYTKYFEDVNTLLSHTNILF